MVWVPSLALGSACVEEEGQDHQKEEDTSNRSEARLFAHLSCTPWRLDGASHDNTNDLDNMTLYDDLEVAPECTSEEIRKQYLRLSLKYHPDKNKDNSEASTARFVRLCNAYEVLSDPSKKAAYDQEIAAGISTGAFVRHPEETSVPSADNLERAFGVFQSVVEALALSNGVCLFRQTRGTPATVPTGYCLIFVLLFW
ncbi:hypothetical protein CYMTET_45636 [Cymbomonas tetramitiformis]|uniref:J domain-containing protein n=1 Tax=Cymbomonas tetramitiformis TaxID=36881 RepID=A0AAE0BZV6_9CHLO|nr:hypothetical protein CYMTET_45636 [Cymbomonas tetramitiformis]